MHRLVLADPLAASHQQRADITGAQVVVETMGQRSFDLDIEDRVDFVSPDLESLLCRVGIGAESIEKGIQS
ncbi:M17 family metallopeptidase [Burkholderia gladioli]|uniref:M17 family metallopeptidase n=1 Tax=Burkholderia gladioli TaxID=28095 RepID=UPI001FC7C1CA|nr:M17 family metallopeptidase [Burkholderia gladioli]URV27577.1 M17 family metallopeptidase [Burkholderia gladioli]